MILVSGKGGRVYAYPCPNVALGQRFLLGHTSSIITDMILGNVGDKAFILTADRDEKIRVTRYVYNDHKGQQPQKTNKLSLHFFHSTWKTDFLLCIT